MLDNKVIHSSVFSTAFLTDFAEQTIKSKIRMHRLFCKILKAFFNRTNEIIKIENAIFRYLKPEVHWFCSAPESIHPQH